ncbi:hypothetical protein NSK_006184 [Nannochloropsis salina CCMP1776]|uniref:Uncharacterized protein n=1 Tax=Nannochloropsis salina CCMP1776 TaxID=1027361 RepID=A0A4D9CUD6_9STRA|nr:hypothetical protein NSK_006184 [Nannochloropsis salina CCMP1776]|eukprot:TFJ82506.1 hypothetical protein NSK_006184 [Nannochloropsis salina CCMP1776]
MGVSHSEVLRVQREEITIDQYVSTLVERVKRDKLLALYCSHQQKRVLAFRVLRRVKIMEEELRGVEGETM